MEESVGTMVSTLDRKAKTGPKNLWSWETGTSPQVSVVNDFPLAPLGRCEALHLKALVHLRGDDRFEEFSLAQSGALKGWRPSPVRL